MDGIRKNFYKLRLSNKTLTRNVNSSKHFFIKYRAYSFDEKLIIKYKGKFKTLKIITSYGKVYTITSADFWSKSQLMTILNKKQRLIKVEYLTIERKQHSKTVILDPNTHQRIKEQANKERMNINTYLSIKHS